MAVERVRSLASPGEGTEARFSTRTAPSKVLPPLTHPSSTQVSAIPENSACRAHTRVTPARVGWAHRSPLSERASDSRQNRSAGSVLSIGSQRKGVWRQRTYLRRDRVLSPDTLAAWLGCGEAADSRCGSATLTRPRPRRQSCASHPAGSAHGSCGVWAIRATSGNAKRTRRRGSRTNDRSAVARGADLPRPRVPDGRREAMQKARWPYGQTDNGAAIDVRGLRTKAPSSRRRQLRGDEGPSVARPTPTGRFVRAAPGTYPGVRARGAQVVRPQGENRSADSHPAALTRPD